jgi:polysaccharide biosynthesis protein PelB
LSAGKRPRLISLPFMIILVMMIGSVFVVLLNGRNDMKNEWADLPPDGLSEAYLKVLLQAEPDNQPARLQLAGLYFTIGDWERAGRVLKEGGEALESLPQAQWLMLRVLLARYSALSAGDVKRPELQKKIQGYLKTLNPARLTPEQLVQLADYGLQMNAPGYAAICYVILAKEDPGNAGEWYAKAGRWSLAAGRPLEAAAYYEQAFEATNDPVAAALVAEEASRAHEAADRGDRALSMIQKALSLCPQNKRLLLRGVVLAIAQQQPEVAKILNLHYLEQCPKDAAALARQVDLEVQGGHKHQALLVSRRYTDLKPHDAAALQKHARLAEWNGLYPEALKTWRTLVQLTKDFQFYPHMLQIAQIGHEVDIELDLMVDLVQRPDLKESEALRFAARYEYLGYPEQADRLICDFSRTHSPSPALLTARAELSERMGDMDTALESRWAVISRSDAQPADFVQTARLLFQMGRGDEAYRVMKQVWPDLNEDDPYALRLVGELSWLQGDFETAALAYRRLWENLTDNDFLRRRMILAYHQLGKTEEVVDLLALRWHHSADPEDFLQALSAARQAEFWPAVGRLLTSSETVQEQIAASEVYWQVKGDWYSYRKDYHQAYRAYRQALALNSRSVAAADGILWSLINAQDRDRLGRWVDTHARSGFPLTEAYAAALQMLGRNNEALIWYEARVDRHQGDVLWLLDFADLLNKAGWGNAAYRVKRHALSVMMEKADTVSDARLTDLAASLQGVPAALRWLAGQPGPLPQAALLNWWFYRQHIDAARLWLLRKHIERSDLPAWQRLQLAMAEMDPEAVESLLRQELITDASDRMSAYTFLERDDLALAEIGGLNQLQPVHRAAAVAAADSLPNLWEARFNTGSIGGLGITDYDGLFWRDRDPYSWGLAAGFSAFGRDDDGLLAVSPDDETRLNGFWHRRRDDVWAVDIGYRDGNGGSVFPLGLRYHSSDRRRWQYQLALENNGMTEVSGLMRLLGVKDSLAAQFDYRIDPRLSVSIGANHHRYLSLGGSRLADGNSAAAHFSYQLFGGANYWVLGGGAAWEHNDDVDQIPADIQPWLAPNVTTAALVPETYYDLGISTALGRGRLETGYPQVASPRWFTDMWIGYIGPESTLGVAARAGLSTALFGGDEIGVTAEYDDRLNRVAGGGLSYQLQFYYRFYLGR